MTVVNPELQGQVGQAAPARTLPCRVCAHPMPLDDLDSGEPCWKCRAKHHEAKLLDAATQLRIARDDEARVASDRDFWKRVAELLLAELRRIE